MTKHFLVQITVHKVLETFRNTHVHDCFKNLNNYFIIFTGGIISFDGSTRQKRVNEKKNDKGETPLHQACLSNNVEKVRNLIKNVSFLLNFNFF